MQPRLELDLLMLTLKLTLLLKLEMGWLAEAYVKEDSDLEDSTCASAAATPKQDKTAAGTSGIVISQVDAEAKTK